MSADGGTCAAPDCDHPVPRRPGGGRPAIYCSPECVRRAARGRSAQKKTAPAEKAAPRLGALAIQYVAERERRKELNRGGARTVHYTLGTFVRSAGWDLRPSRLTRCHVERWMDRRNLSSASLRSQLSIVRTFCEWLVDRGYARRNPTREIRSPRQPRLLPRALQPEAVDALFEAAPDTRAALIISLMVQEGLRCAEVAGLELGEVDLREAVLVVRHGKGGHERLLPLSDETVSHFERYLAEYPAAAGPVIRSYRHPTRGVTAKYLSKMVSEVFRAARVPESAHALRHTMATDVLRSGANLRDVQAALGHSSLMTTQRYLPYVVGDLREAMGGRQYQGGSTIA